MPHERRRPRACEDHDPGLRRDRPPPKFLPSGPLHVEFRPKVSHLAESKGLGEDWAIEIRPGWRGSNATPTLVVRRSPSGRDRAVGVFPFASGDCGQYLPIGWGFHVLGLACGPWRGGAVDRPSLWSRCLAMQCINLCLISRQGLPLLRVVHFVTGFRLRQARLVLFAQGANMQQDHQHDRRGEDGSDGPFDKVERVLHADHG